MVGPWAVYVGPGGCSIGPLGPGVVDLCAHNGVPGDCTSVGDSGRVTEGTQPT